MNVLPESMTNTESPAMPDEFNTKEAAERLGISPSRVRHLAIEHKIGRKFTERSWLFTIEDLVKLGRVSTGKIGRPRKNRHGDPTEAEPPLDASPAEPMGS